MSKDRYQSIFWFTSFISTTRTNWRQRTSTNQSFDPQVLIKVKQGKITQVQQRTNWMQFVPFLTVFSSLYTQSNKNPSTRNFLSPELEVTCSTVAIIIWVVLLSPFLHIHVVSLSPIHYNQSHTVYMNQRKQYICLIWN